MLKRNRDITKKNRSNLAVRGCIYSKICLKAVKVTTQKLKRLKRDKDEEILALLDVAHKSSEMMVDCFTASQNSINNTVLKNYASSQHTLLTNAIELNEDPENVPELSNMIVNKDIIELSRSLAPQCQSESKFIIHHFDIYMLTTCNLGHTTLTTQLSTQYHVVISFIKLIIQPLKRLLPQQLPRMTILMKQ